MFEELKNLNRLLIEVPLEPVQGDRFQPTGFPDIGAGLYQLPDGTRKILLESSQSMANRLENTIIGPDSEVIDDFKGLSYIRVKFEGASEASTNSLIEAHRMNSPFIISDNDFKKAFVSDSGYGKGVYLDWRRIGRTIFKYDINSLLHGIFLSNLEDGRVKIPRAITGFIEATDVKEVVTGGVKNNLMDPAGVVRAAGYDKDGVYSNVPYQRMEYTASEIKAFFNFDIGMIRAYALSEQAVELLIGLGLFKIRSFLEGGLRLRTACDLKRKSGFKLTIQETAGFDFPEMSVLIESIRNNIVACRELFAQPAVTELTTKTILKEKKGVAVEEE